MQSTTAGDTAHRNRWSSAVTSVEPVTTSTREDTETISSQDTRVAGDTQSQPVRKSPRLRQLDDDEVVEVPPPKVYTVVDLTEEGTETTSTLKHISTTQMITPIRRRGRPCKSRPQTQESDKKNTTITPSKSA